MSEGRRIGAWVKKVKGLSKGKKRTHRHSSQYGDYQRGRWGKREVEEHKEG